jgi:hypothetical protein
MLLWNCSWAVSPKDVHPGVGQVSHAAPLD